MLNRIGDKVFEATPEEIAEEKAAMEAEATETERRYCLGISYGEAVNAEIRKRYTASDEFSILRQRDDKPEEYEAYYAYCEECKRLVKESQRRWRSSS